MFGNFNWWGFTNYIYIDKKMSVTGSVAYSYLKNLRACPEALDFVATQSANSAVDTCPYSTWMIWYSRVSGTFSDQEILKIKNYSAQRSAGNLSLLANGLDAQAYADIWIASNFNNGGAKQSMDEYNALAWQDFGGDNDDPNKHKNFGLIMSSQLEVWDPTSESYAGALDVDGVGLSNSKTEFGQRVKDDFNNRTLVTNGLLAHLDSGVPYSLVSSSTSFLDLSGNLVVGTLSNGANYSSLSGGLVELDGSNDFIDMGQRFWFGNPGNNLTNNFSIRIVFNSPTYSSYQPLGTPLGQVLFSRGSYNNNGYYVDINASTIRWNGVTASNSTQFRNSDFITNSINTWYDVTVTRDAGGGSVNDGTVKIYRNGVQVMNFTQSIDPIFSSDNFRIGAYSNVGFSPIKIMHFSVYDRVLSQSEITRNYDAIKGRFDSLLPTTTTSTTTLGGAGLGKG